MRQIVGVLPGVEVVAVVLGAYHEPEAAGSHGMERVHFVLCVGLIPLNLFQVIDHLDIAVKGVFLFGLRWFVFGTLSLLPILFLLISFS